MTLCLLPLLLVCPGLPPFAAAPTLTNTDDQRVVEAGATGPERDPLANTQSRTLLNARPVRLSTKLGRNFRALLSPSTLAGRGGFLAVSTPFSA